jgi:processive 1,2-diacylglycerol beta-glucosyltransferase
MDLLILSISAGGGHTQAAQAIAKYMNKHHKHLKVEVIDWLKFVNPVIDKVVIGSYMGTLKVSPALYEKLYDIAEKEEGISDLSRSINRLLAVKMSELLLEKNPKIVVCTHPFPLEVACYLKNKRNLKYKVVSLLTDFAPHSFWIREGVDYYVVPNEDMLCEMEQKGVDKKKVHALGIPIDEAFSLQYNPAIIREAIGLSRDKTTLLIMGGSLGMGEVGEVFRRLLKSTLDIQMIVVCGKNRKLKEAMDKMAAGFNKPAVVLGYTGVMPRLMAASSLIITKPGGLTISEAMAMKLPIAIISPIPGQEERNAQYLMNSGMAIRLASKAHIECTIKQLLDTPVRLQHMKEMAALKSKPHSTADVCRLFTEILDGKR